LGEEGGVGETDRLILRLTLLENQSMTEDSEKRVDSMVDKLFQNAEALPNSNSASLFATFT